MLGGKKNNEAGLSPRCVLLGLDKDCWMWLTGRPGGRKWTSCLLLLLLLVQWDHIYSRLCYKERRESVGLCSEPYIRFKKRVMKSDYKGQWRRL